jgi:hypothetical protein
MAARLRTILLRCGWNDGISKRAILLLTQRPTVFTQSITTLCESIAVGIPEGVNFLLDRSPQQPIHVTGRLVKLALKELDAKTLQKLLDRAAARGGKVLRWTTLRAASVCSSNRLDLEPLSLLIARFRGFYAGKRLLYAFVSGIACSSSSSPTPESMLAKILLDSKRKLCDHGDLHSTVLEMGTVQGIWELLETPSGCVFDQSDFMAVLFDRVPTDQLPLARVCYSEC